MNYLSFYGLKSEPFSNAPVTQFYFESTQQAAALVRLRYVAEQMKGLALLIGNIGAGKTTLARRMLDSLPENQFEAALLVIIHSGITANWLLKRIAIQLGIEKPADDKLTLLSQLYRRLLQIHKEGRKAIVLIDEAQMLTTRELMEEFRGLLNLEIPGKKLITFIFFGLPEIEENLKLDPPLLQRVALRCRLDAFDQPGSELYIQYRMQLAGAAKNIFTHKAMQRIHQFSEGFPRLINTLCDNCLLEGALLKKPLLDENLVQIAAASLGLGPPHEVEVEVTVPPVPNVTASAPVVPLKISPKVKTLEAPVAEPEIVFDAEPELVEEVTKATSMPPVKNPAKPPPPTSMKPPIAAPMMAPEEEKEYEEVFERLTQDNPADDIDKVLEGLVEKKPR